MRKRLKGQAVVLAIFIVFLSSVAAALGFSALVVSRAQVARQSVVAERAFFVAEAGLEDAVHRLRNLMQISSSYVFSVGSDGTASVSVVGLGSLRTITSLGTVGSVSRRVQATVRLSSESNVPFNYGVQVGEGGVRMENNSDIFGSVYSNGSIVRVTGGQPQDITGDAFVASGTIENIAVGGNAYAPTIDGGTVDGNAEASIILDDVAVGGSVSANTIRDCTIGGNADYNTEGPPKCVVGGIRTTPNPSPPSAPEALDLPITQAQIDAWKNEAQGGGVIFGDVLLDGTSSTLGPVKITGNLTLNNNAVLTMAGTVWVEGNVLLDNGSLARLDPAYEAFSGVLVNDGWIQIDNGGQLRGSGDPASHFMILTTIACTGVPAPGCGANNAAINIKNNVIGAIFYAQEGLIRVGNNVAVTELVGWGIYMNNNASLTYDIGLADARFSSGPSVGWEILTWREIE